MPNLDEELAAAASAHNDNATNDELGHEVPPSVFANRADRPAPKRNLGLLVALLAMAGVILALVFNFRDAAVYAKTVDQLVAEKGRLSGRAVRVQGTLVKGSLVHQEQPCEYRFRVAHAGVEMPVRFAQCVVPDTFRDAPTMDVDVTVEGKLTEAGSFEASQLMAKCPSKYEMKQRAANGEQMPHAAMPTN